MGSDLGLLVSCGLSGHLTEAQAEEFWIWLPSLLSLLSLFPSCACSAGKPPPPPPTTVPWNVLSGEHSNPSSVFVRDFTPTRLTTLTPPDRASLFRCRIVGFSHKVFTGYVKHNHGFMNMN